MFTVYFGPRPVVMLCGTQTIREALVDHAEAFSGRRIIALLQPIMQEYGEIWDKCGVEEVGQGNELER